MAHWHVSALAKNHLEFTANVIVNSNGTGSWFACTIVLRRPIT
ncbi:hypothetical protein JMJ77_0011364, partial [Colletotrichum scovillei]